MTHAEKCPICLGSGKKDFAVYGVPDTTAGNLSSSAFPICNACSGRGWVEVSD